MRFLSEEDKVNLQAIADSIRKIESFVGIQNSEQFRLDEKTFDSVLMNFVVIGGESVERLSDAFRNSNPEVPWRKIKYFRNLVAPNYFGIDSEEVWQLIHTHLPTLKQRVKNSLV